MPHATSGKKIVPKRKRPKPVALPVKRRKPGENWNLWHVCSGETPFGYLVTDRERCPNPIAYIHAPGRKAEKGFQLAAAIRDGKRRAGSGGSIDLRGDGWWRVRGDRLLQLKLLPLDAAGRSIGNHSRWVYGMYQPNFMKKDAAPNFFMAIRTVTQPTTRTHEKSGTPEKPIALTPGSNKGNEASLLTAA
jgi:hypothetical protein